jgi:hypothetical protein
MTIIMNLVIWNIILIAVKKTLIINVLEFLLITQNLFDNNILVI